MIAHLFNKPLTIKIADRKLKFDSKIDFEFALASRTEVPAAKLSDLVRCDPQQLLDDANAVRQMERHFVEILSRSIQKPGSISSLLREMDMNMFSQDHEWRAIMQALGRQKPRYNDYKQLALVKYMQYLASRQDVLKEIYAHKVASDDDPELEIDSALDPEFRQTLTLDAARVPPAPAHEKDPVTPSRLVRLPRGECICVSANSKGTINLVLSTHAFRLRAKPKPILVDDAGGEIALRPGRNVLGRHPDSDITIDAACRDVSRTHAIVEMRKDGTVCITDLSSLGTFVDADLVKTA